jgi:hypothetical protein
VGVKHSKAADSLDVAVVMQRVFKTNKTLRSSRDVQ